MCVWQDIILRPLTAPYRSPSGFRRTLQTQDRPQHRAGAHAPAPQLALARRDPALLAIAGGGWFASQPRVDHRADDADRHDVSLAAVRGHQFHRLRRGAAQGGDLVEGYPGGWNGWASRKARASRRATSSRASTSAMSQAQVEARCANVQVARAALEQAQAEDRDAASSAQAHARSHRAKVRLGVGARHGQSARRSRGRRRRKRQGGALPRPRPTRAIRRSPSTTPSFALRSTASSCRRAPTSATW